MIAHGVWFVRLWSDADVVGAACAILAVALARLALERAVRACLAGGIGGSEGRRL
jgi:hypothetical protein